METNTMNSLTPVNTELIKIGAGAWDRGAFHRCVALAREFVDGGFWDNECKLWVHHAYDVHLEFSRHGFEGLMFQMQGDGLHVYEYGAFVAGFAPAPTPPQQPKPAAARVYDAFELLMEQAKTGSFFSVQDVAAIAQTDDATVLECARVLGIHFDAQNIHEYSAPAPTPAQPDDTDDETDFLLEDEIGLCLDCGQYGDCACNELMELAKATITANEAAQPDDTSAQNKAQETTWEYLFRKAITYNTIEVLWEGTWQELTYLTDYLCHDMGIEKAQDGYLFLGIAHSEITHILAGGFVTWRYKLPVCPECELELPESGECFWCAPAPGIDYLPEGFSDYVEWALAPQLANQHAINHLFAEVL